MRACRRVNSASQVHRDAAQSAMTGGQPRDLGPPRSRPARAVAHELTGATTKIGRAGPRSPFRILDDALNARVGQRLRAVVGDESASHNRRHFM